ncbi:sorcin-like [Asterias amurensis]|uniref:sorcin-like n=1 Tax=Asterias amurensis TaxID=7602 RepID=UPI003AB6E456
MWGNQQTPYNPNQGYGAQQHPPPQQGYGQPQQYAPPPQQQYGAPQYRPQQQHPQQAYNPHQQQQQQQQHGYQQYGAPPGGAVPPGGDPTLWHWFQAVDVDKSGAITAAELRQALVNGNWSHFNEETCRLMIGMFDKDKNGTINFQEFAALWKYIQDWKQCFERFDRDRSGNIDANELHLALASFGYNVSPAFCSMIVQKFDRGSVRTIKLDDFIQCCVMIRSLTEAFRQKDTNASGVIKIHFEEFLEMVLENGIH